MFGCQTYTTTCSLVSVTPPTSAWTMDERPSVQPKAARRLRCIENITEIPSCWQIWNTVAFGLPSTNVALPGPQKQSSSTFKVAQSDKATTLHWSSTNCLIGVKNTDVLITTQHGMNPSWETKGSQQGSVWPNTMHGCLSLRRMSTTPRVIPRKEMSCEGLREGRIFGAILVTWEFIVGDIVSPRCFTFVSATPVCHPFDFSCRISFVKLSTFLFCPNLAS